MALPDPLFDTQSSRRLHLLARLVFAWALLLFGRLIYLQVFKHEELKAAAVQQQEHAVKLRLSRGAIFDRGGQPLAISLASDSFCVNPKRIRNLETAAGVIAECVGGNSADWLAGLSRAQEEKSGFLWIKRHLTAAETRKLETLRKTFDWIEIRPEFKRQYPNDELAASVIGSLDADEKGNAGLELALNAELAGQTGEATLLADVRKTAYETRVKSRAIPGKNITLTIDSRVQYATEQALRAGVKRTRADSGMVVVMDPKTGDILALADYPTFNPNEPMRPGEGRGSLAVTTPYEPGSVFKMFTMASVFELTSLTPASVIDCGMGSLTWGGRVIHDTHPYGALRLEDAFAKSSNIGAIQAARQMERADFHRYLQAFGLGQKTNIGLPGENRGRLRPVGRWSKTSIGSIAMGHEVMTTAIQLAQAGAVFANGGFRVSPRLILKKQSPDGPVEAMPASEPVRVLRPENAIAVRQMLERVVLVGTGKKARLKGYTAGGKTGSAQIFDVKTGRYTHSYNASFLGIAPLKDPALVIVVSLIGTHGGAAGYGGETAAPVFREIATAALRLLDVPKDLPEDFGPGEESNERMPDLAIAGLDPDEKHGEKDSDEFASVPTTPAGPVFLKPDQRPFLRTKKAAPKSPARARAPEVPASQ
jgi:cell division protein FtsI (penicillin-binding protein 3)